MASRPGSLEPAARASLPGAAKALARVRKICLALPEVTEKPSHGTPTFFIRARPTFAMFWDNHHGDGRLAIWCATVPGARDVLLQADPDRFFYPQYVGHRGWIGIRVDGEPEWDRVKALLEDAYRAVAPAKLAALV